MEQGRKGNDKIVSLNDFATKSSSKSLVKVLS